MGLVFYYVILPIFAGSLLIRWLKKASPARVEPDVAALYAEKPVEKKWFRAVRRDHTGLRSLGDYETRLEAVEAAYQGRKDAKAAGDTASFVVLDDKGFALEQIDS
jgi:hypothetical protein